MKNIDTDTMVKVKVASKKLGIAKGKIKDMINNKEISFEIVNGIYYVDLNEVKDIIEKINNNFSYIKTLNAETDVIDDYVDNFDKVFLIDTLSMIKDYGKVPIEINGYFVNQYIFSKFDKNDVENILCKLNKFIPIENNYGYMNYILEETQFFNKSYVDYKIGIATKSISDYSLFEFENYIFLFHLDIYNGIKTTLSNLWKKEDFKKNILKKEFNKEIKVSNTLSKKYLNYSNNDRQFRRSLERKLWAAKISLNSIIPYGMNDTKHSSSPKSQHTVNGFWRKQPYGSRSNPKYKMIWIESFERGGKKVG